MISVRRTKNRRGFSLILVISTLGIIMGFWSVAYKMTSSLIRVESSKLPYTNRSEQSIHSMTVLDRVLTLLEISKPTSRQYYSYSYDLILTDGTHKLYTVELTPNNSLAGVSNGWTVTISPGSSAVNLSLPNPGDNPQWP
jgi:hypothetical protein